MTLDAIMAQLVRMDARLDNLNDELRQVNTRIGHIVWRQAIMGDFTVASSLSSSASKDESDEVSSSADEDDGASPNDDEMFVWCTFPLSLMTKRGSSFDMRVVILIGEGLV